MKIEVCVDNLESVFTAIQAGADRLELCGCLSVGGVTPAYSFIKYVAEKTTIEAYLMIRPRAGDFIFSTDEVEMMLTDIQLAKQLGIKGIVIGALTPNGEIDIPTCQRLIKAANGMNITFHRAFDLCINPTQALETIIELGCDRILTSGQANNALAGRKKLAELVKQAKGRIKIMAGAGITVNNVKQIITETGVDELHLSGKKYRSSPMNTHSTAIMGTSAEDDQKIWVTDFDIIRNIKSLIP